MNAQELYDAAVTLRDSAGYADVAAVVTTGRKSHLLWVSKGEIRKAKKIFRQGICECFIVIRMNGATRFKAETIPLEGMPLERAQHLLWRFGRAYGKWQNG